MNRSTKQICPEKGQGTRAAMRNNFYRAIMLGASAMILVTVGVAWRFAPPNSVELVQRGRIAAHAGRLDEAANCFEAALKLNPKSADGWLMIGCCRAESGNPSAAIADFNRCLVLNFNNATAWYDRGLAHADLGDRETAAHDFARALELNPDHARAKAALARVTVEKIAVN